MDNDIDVKEIEVEGEEIEELPDVIEKEVDEEIKELNDKKWQELIDIVKLEVQKVDSLAQKYNDEIASLRGMIAGIADNINKLIMEEQMEEHEEEPEEPEIIEQPKKRSKYARH